MGGLVNEPLEMGGRKRKSTAAGLAESDNDPKRLRLNNSIEPLSTSTFQALPPTTPALSAPTQPLPAHDGLPAVTPPLAPIPGSAPAGPLAELEQMDFYAEPPVQPLALSSTEYPVDAEGFLQMPTPPPYDPREISEAIAEKMKNSPDDLSWVERVAAGIVLHVGNTEKKGGKSPRRGSLSAPNYIPYQDAMNFLVAYMALSTDISVSDQFELPGTDFPSDVIAKHLSVFAEYLDIFQKLQKMTTAPQLLLLRHDPNTQRQFLRVLLRAMSESLSFLAPPTTEDAPMQDEEEKKKALQTLLVATQLLNRTLHEELLAYHRCWPALDAAARKVQKKIAFPFEWLAMVVEENTAQHYATMVLQAMALIQNLPVPAQDEQSAHWSCFCEMATFLFHVCTSDQYVALLLASPQGERLCVTISQILQTIAEDESPNACRIRYHILRILTVLCEKEEPYFLDYLGPLACGSTMADVVLKEASHVVSKIHGASTGENVNVKDERFMSAREAFRVMELFSYDSNFVTCVVEQATPFLLEILSVPSSLFVDYLQAIGSFQQYISLLIFRIIANLHCYNPEVSPKDHKGKFVRTILQQCSTIHGVDDAGEMVRKRPLVTPHIMANLFYLLQWVVFRSTYTGQEYSFWRDFMDTLQGHLGIKFPTINLSPSVVSAMGILPPTPSETKARKSHAHLESKPKSNILAGVSVSLGRVHDQEDFKRLVRMHGGTVLEYVSKSVTHVICSADDEALVASSAKIQSAASKQVPACSDQFIYDSIEKGKLQHERIYLISDHPYKRRLG